MQWLEVCFLQSCGFLKFAQRGCPLTLTSILSTFYSLPLLMESFSLLQAMLIFIYSDALPDFHDLTGSVLMSSTTNIVQHLLAAADRYGLERLKLLCEAKLCEQVTADTVASTMALAEQYQCSHLKSVCLKFAAAPENLRGEYSLQH